MSDDAFKSDTNEKSSFMVESLALQNDIGGKLLQCNTNGNPRSSTSTPRSKNTSAINSVRHLNFAGSISRPTKLRTPTNASTTAKSNSNKSAPICNNGTKSKKVVTVGGDDLTALQKHQRHHTKFGATLRKETILSHRHYKAVCTFAIVVFIVLHLSLGLNHYLAEQPLCPFETPGSPWIRDINIFTAGGLVFAMFLQMNRIQLSTFREHNDIGTMSSYFASLCVNFIAGISHISIVFWDWGGNCKDAYGIITPAAMWPEWLISVPLMLFIAVSVDDKPYLSIQDICIIGSNFLMIAFGCALQLTGNKAIGALCFIASSMCCLSVYVLLYQAREELHFFMHQFHVQSKRAPPSGESQRKLLLTSRKVTLITCIAALFPAFPLAYLFRWFGYMDDNMLFSAFLMLSAGTKVVYASLCMDAHLEVSHPAIGLIDAEKFSNTSRRAFIRYVFHEVRVPLNSIALGIQILANHNRDENNDTAVAVPHPVYDKTQLDTLSMIRDAVNFMGDTLNDVMALQKVEEGSLELILKPFSIYDLFQNIEDTFLEISSTTDVTLETMIDSNMPTQLIGDKFRIRHVLCNLVSNAMKFSNPGSVVKLIVESDGHIDRPQDVLPRSFKVPNSRKDRGKGNNIKSKEKEKGIRSVGSGGTRIIRSNQPLPHQNNKMIKNALNASNSDKSSLSNTKNTNKIVPSTSPAPQDQAVDEDSIDYDDKYNEHVTAKFIKFQVIDEGQGIPKDVANDIFSPFHRLKDGELTEGRGSGLGLAICREIVHMHGGQISFVSVLGEGTTFTVVLPLEVFDIPSEQSPTLSPKSTSTSSKASSLSSTLINSIPVLRSLSSDPEEVRSNEDSSSSSKIGETTVVTEMSSTNSNDSNLRRRRVIKKGDSFNENNEANSPVGLRYPTLSSVMTINSIDDEEPLISSLMASSSGSNKRGSAAAVAAAAAAASTAALKLNSKFQQPSKSSPNKDDNLIMRAINDNDDRRISRNGSRMSTGLPSNHQAIFVDDLDASVHDTSGFGDHSTTVVEATRKETDFVNHNRDSIIQVGDSNHLIHKDIESEMFISAAQECDKTMIVTKTTTIASSETIVDENIATINVSVCTEQEAIREQNEPEKATAHFHNESITETTSVCIESSKDAVKLEEKTDVKTIIQSMKIDIPPPLNLSAPTKNNVQSPSSRPTNTNVPRKFEELTNLQVLIVDDVTSNRKLLAMLLQQKGIKNIDFAEDGVKVLQCVESKGLNHYGVIFMDNTMPNMTGLQATQILRKMAFPHLIIGVTGNAMEDELTEFLDGGADLVISKPMRSNMLEMVLNFMVAQGTASHYVQDKRMVVIDRELHWQSYYYSANDHEELTMTHGQPHMPQLHQQLVKS